MPSYFGMAKTLTWLNTYTIEKEKKYIYASQYNPVIQIRFKISFCNKEKCATKSFYMGPVSSVFTQKAEQAAFSLCDFCFPLRSIRFLLQCVATVSIAASRYLDQLVEKGIVKKKYFFYPFSVFFISFRNF